MKSLKIVLFTLFALLGTLVAVRADDEVKLLDNKSSKGKLVEMSPTEVTIELGTTRRKFAVNELDSVKFNGEPPELTLVRGAIRGGRNQDALNSLNKIKTDSIVRDEILDDIEFYKALTSARLALGGQGSLADAAKKLQAFEKAHPKNYHYFDACEAAGDLLAAQGKPGAESYYAKMAEAPWPDYKMRAKVSMGRALVNDKKYEQAIDRFEEALRIDYSGPDTVRLRAAAQLGSIAAKAGIGQTDEAIRSVEDFIAGSQDDALQARAYNIMGTAYQQAGREKEALYAFLRVDLLYSRFPEQHAEALSHLATLWPDERAAQARATLKQKYPDSPWAK